VCLPSRKALVNEIIAEVKYSEELAHEADLNQLRNLAGLRAVDNHSLLVTNKRTKEVL
jgi:hypothetical protein